MNGLNRVLQYYQRNTNIKLPIDLTNEIDINGKNYIKLDTDKLNQSFQVFLYRIYFLFNCYSISN